MATEIELGARGASASLADIGPGIGGRRIIVVVDERHVVTAIMDPLDRFVIRLITPGLRSFQTMMLNRHSLRDFDVSQALMGVWIVLTALLALGGVFITPKSSILIVALALGALLATTSTMALFHGVVRRIWPYLEERSPLVDLSLAAIFGGAMALWTIASIR